MGKASTNYKAVDREEKILWEIKQALVKKQIF
jgi:hypothetical protein